MPCVTRGRQKFISIISQMYETVNLPRQPGQWEWPHSIMALGAGCHPSKHPGAPRIVSIRAVFPRGRIPLIPNRRFRRGLVVPIGLKSSRLLGHKITPSQRQRKDLEQLLCTPQFPTTLMRKISYNIFRSYLKNKVQDTWSDIIKIFKCFLPQCWTNFHQDVCGLLPDLQTVF